MHRNSDSLIIRRISHTPNEATPPPSCVLAEGLFGLGNLETGVLQDSDP